MSESVSLSVSGMKCGGCENNITAKLLALPGVDMVKASHQNKRIDIEYDPTQTDMDEIEDTITEAGFTVE